MLRDERRGRAATASPSHVSPRFQTAARRVASHYTACTVEGLSVLDFAASFCFLKFDLASACVPFCFERIENATAARLESTVYYVSSSAYY